MDSEIQALEEQLLKLRREEHQLIKQADAFKVQRRSDLLKEIDRLRRSNERRRSEIQLWKKTATRWSESIQSASPTEMAPQQEMVPSPPEESRTSPTKKVANTSPKTMAGFSTQDASPEQRRKGKPSPPEESKTPSTDIHPKSSKKCKIKSIVSYQYNPMERKITWSSSSFTETLPQYGSPLTQQTPSPPEHTQTVQDTTNPIPDQPQLPQNQQRSEFHQTPMEPNVTTDVAQPSTSTPYEEQKPKETKSETAHQRAQRIADTESDSEESITTELNPKLIVWPIVKLNRLEEVDTSTIIEERTRKIPHKNVSKQLDTRSRKQITRDDYIMRFVGEETRIGFQHNKKTAIRVKKQATWREKRRRQIKEWEEASRREEEDKNAEKNKTKKKKSKDPERQPDPETSPWRSTIIAKSEHPASE